MLAVNKNIKDDNLVNLVRIQGDELKKRDAKIAKLQALLEEQAKHLIQSRNELDACRRQLGLSAAV